MKATQREFHPIPASGPASTPGDAPPVRGGQPVTRHAGEVQPTDAAWRSTGCSSTRWNAEAGSLRPSQARAWTAFWQEQGSDSRCLAGVHPEVRRALDDHWACFAAALAPAARILDLGCGSGAVARALLVGRDDLSITGIDLASVPAPSDRRLALLPETAMERLPFAEASFDAAVSQFGFEYGEVEQGAKELARVLVPGAPFSFVVHHGSSAIVRTSRARNRALRGLLGEDVRRAFLSGHAAELDRQIGPVRSSLPTEPLVGQVAQALRAKVGRHEAQRAAIWTAVAEALAPERVILDALDSACVADSDLDRWLAGFAGRFEIATVRRMHGPGGDVIAWAIDGNTTAAD